MKAFRSIAALALAAALVAAAARLSTALGADDDVDTIPALDAAQAWLAEVDGGAYAKSWDDAAALFQGAMPKEKWEKSLVAVRSPLGAVVARKLRSVSYRKEVPGGPAGDYVVLDYETRFENRPVAVETVTPMREKDGRWRVAGYYVR
jgi:hypothetical protein